MTRNRLILIAAFIVFLFVCFVMLSRCQSGNDAAQVEHAAEKAEAFQNAVEAGVSTIQNNTASRQEIDRAAAVTMLEIDGADSFDNVQRAVCERMREKGGEQPAC